MHRRTIRRYNKNRLYGLIHPKIKFTSEQKEDNTIMTSRLGALDRFAEFISETGSLSAKSKVIWKVGFM